MKLNYQAAIFDMDGTILDTLEDLMVSTNYALSQYQMPTRNLEEVRLAVGNGLLKLVERVVPAGTAEERIHQVHQTLVSYYQTHCAVQTAPYPGILPLLQSLRAQGVLTAVVTNKVDSAAQKLCQTYFPGLFDAAVGERDGIRKKPAPDSVNEVLRELRLKPEEAVYIGDSEVDLQTAANAGMDCIGVSWGFRGKEFLEVHGAQVIVDEPVDIGDRLFCPQYPRKG